MELNIKSLLSEWLLEQSGSPVTKIYTDMFQTDTEGNYVDEQELVCRYDPSEKSEFDFIDGTKQVVQKLSFYSRCKSMLTAREWLQWVLDTVDKKRVQLDGVTVDLDAVTLPQFVSVDNRGYIVYTVSISAAYNDDTTAFEDAFTTKGD